MEQSIECRFSEMKYEHKKFQTGPSLASILIIFSLFKQTMHTFKQSIAKNVLLVSGAGIWTHHLLIMSHRY